MLRSLFRARQVLPLTYRSSPVFRQFHVTPITFKKRDSKASKSAALDDAKPGDEAPQIDFDEVTAKLQLVVDKFSTVANEVKLGKTNPHIFDHLVVQTPDGDVPFSSVAHTSVKGRNFILTVFDQSHSKHVINAVLGSDLNMNAIQDPTNHQLLKVPLPPVTTESKKENVKQLKAVFEKFKNGPGKHSNTLAAIRSDAKHKIAKKKKMTPEETALWNQYEALHKKFNDKLAETFKAAEIAIMK